jgi:hypothetical protein
VRRVARVRRRAYPPTPARVRVRAVLPSADERIDEVALPQMRRQTCRCEERERRRVAAEFDPHAPGTPVSAVDEVAYARRRHRARATNKGLTASRTAGPTPPVGDRDRVVAVNQEQRLLDLGVAHAERPCRPRLGAEADQPRPLRALAAFGQVAARSTCSPFTVTRCRA